MISPLMWDFFAKTITIIIMMTNIVLIYDKYWRVVFLWTDDSNM